MLENQFLKKGTLVKPGVVGKTVRIVFGLAMTGWVIKELVTYETMTTGIEFPISGKWIGIFFMFYFLNDVFNIGFNRRWNKWPQIVFLALVMMGILMTFLQTGGFWGPLVGWPIYIMAVSVAGFIAVSFFLGSLLATPG